MDERLAYLFEANRRRLARLRRIVIVLAILLVVVVCIAVALAVALFEANRRRLARLRRIVIVLAILLVVVVCIAVALAVILLQLKLESLIAESKHQKYETDGSITRPEKLTRIVFAINVVGKKNGRTKDDHRRLSANVIRSIVSKRSSDGTEFALQKYSVPENTTFTMFSNPYKILRLLDAAMDLDFPFDNPNQTENPLVYENDMKDSNEALNRISAAKNHVVVVGDVSVFHATDATIISSKGTVDEITSRINNHLCELNLTSKHPAQKDCNELSTKHTQSHSNSQNFDRVGELKE
ncbi:hypothetical protein Tcan_18241 [Toxocara canis]|uniref:Uncharacterized protein n=1 Tax=Toxocara canis TaxID=6265 RepID=A0A0B2UWU3_TOXCA|nr:hypothetical protein Tcan_18241 [Toxocara canis]